ncbi:hypothetical protein GO988_18810 [Hymenobacter sp. HMF4947]|uniref:Uncharacterized protein n=1 Tax=Hymenobacter ginkgonis TaxID=2682976 RepID=A0A7K1TJ00_9BACT|nr:hypothetical protein [Hymenobacter ginkgonis]MVN78387.1 hypothetical protein [Hymenobacter ginkgonis]
MCKSGYCLNWLAGLAGLLLSTVTTTKAQAVPNPAERIESLITFGAQAPTNVGDDDFTQTFFFLVPATERRPFYIRVFDPDCGGTLDAKVGEFNTRTEFSLYGGPDTHSGKGAVDPRPASPTAPPTGRLIKQLTYGVDPAVDGKYVNFGPLNPLEGELVEQFEGYVFKVVVRGLSGNDGNLYRFFLSSSPNLNVPIPGGNAFTYEYCFRLPAAPPSGRPVVVHLYPFANEHVVSIKQSNFDMDSGAKLTVFSVAKNGHESPVSGDGQWTSSVLPVDVKEHGLSLDFRLTSKATVFNDMVFYVTDQYDKALPFFAVPLGGPPRYKYDIDMKVHR